jgi:hypothetical protein
MIEMHDYRFSGDSAYLVIQCHPSWAIRYPKIPSFLAVEIQNWRSDSHLDLDDFFAAKRRAGWPGAAELCRWEKMFSTAYHARLSQTNHWLADGEVLRIILWRSMDLRASAILPLDQDESLL